jgi:hypothetical protein
MYPYTEEDARYDLEKSSHEATTQSGCVGFHGRGRPVYPVLGVLRGLEQLFLMAFPCEDQNAPIRTLDYDGGV